MAVIVHLNNVADPSNPVNVSNGATYAIDNNNKLQVFDSSTPPRQVAIFDAGTWAWAILA